MKRVYPMPFGAEVLNGGGTRFRLWAPSAKSVTLVLKGATRAELPMKVCEGGWYECTVPNAHAGERYAFRIDGGMCVPDPASRFNPEDVHAASEVIDPRAYTWRDETWQGRPWYEAVVYELHVGTFTHRGTYAAATERLDYLVDLGVTVIELMPLAEFPGKRNWGYDGVLLYAPNANYGRPEELKNFIDAAHARGLMVLLDVVYNHFGPEGNYLHTYAQPFFNARHQTPWGAAINFDDLSMGAHTVRDFFVHNALYWLEEYHFDGLRLDAVHEIYDDTQPHIVRELADAIAEGPGRQREIHLVLENELNQAHFLGRDPQHRPMVATAQWNDDFHHCAHVLATAERDGYYVDYADQPLARLGRCLAEGFAYQNEVSQFREGELRGEPSIHLPATAFIDFLQNHDQIGNRAFGERLHALAPAEAVEALATCLLLAPSVPMLFMGEEFAASAPFLFFCDFGPDLADKVTAGRRSEFGRFERFHDPVMQSRIPDPNAADTFERSKLDWAELERPSHRARLALYKRLLSLRREYIVPRLKAMAPSGSYTAKARAPLAVHWTLNDGAHLHLLANLSMDTVRGDTPQGRIIYAHRAPQAQESNLPPWSVIWSLESFAHA